jgi:hypothetical protein
MTMALAAIPSLFSAASATAAGATAGTAAAGGAAAGGLFSIAHLAEGASVLSSIGSGVIGATTSSQAQEIGHIQAEQFREQARLANQAAGAEVAATDTQATSVIAHNAAAVGASGITAESGKPIMAEDYQRAKIQEAYERYSGRLASTNDIYQARLAAWQGGKTAATGAVTSALGSAAGLGEEYLLYKGVSGVPMFGGISGVGMIQ